MISTKCKAKAVMAFFGTFLLLMTMADGASAATIEVRQSGCDALPNCYVTIGDAIAHAQPGDTVEVYPGLYEESVVIDKDLSLFGSGCQNTTILAPGNGVTTDPYVTAEIRGFTITGTFSGIHAKVPKNLVVRNNCIVGNGIAGISMSLELTQAGPILLAANNVIGMNVGDGISCVGCYTATVSAFNNIIFGNGQGDINVTAQRALNVAFNSAYGNNINNFTSPPNISVDCLFIGPSSGNFVLQSGSPCKDAGIDGPTYTDPDGSRNDLGAYGGPYAAAFWPYLPGTPTITEITLTPPSVPKGMPITINATAETR